MRVSLIPVIVLGCVLVAAAAIAPGRKGNVVPSVDVALKADVAPVVAANNLFALDIYGQMAKEPGNLLLSPYSISSALAMTYAGAAGETAKQMASVMHFGTPPEQLFPAFSALNGMWNTGGKGFELSVANALWAQSGFSFSKEFVTTVDKYFDSGFKKVDYTGEAPREKARQEINKWVLGKTNGKVKELIVAKPPVLTPLTRLVLTNAIYFKGKWQVPFVASNTKAQPFSVSQGESVDVQMMHLKARFAYSEDDKAQVLEMPYAGGELAMVLILPSKGSSLGDVEASLRKGGYEKRIADLTRREVDVLIPRFKLEKGATLNDNLRQLGMVDAFDENRADFTGMTKESRLHITSVIHKAFMEVNEEGTEAAAATAVVMGTKSIMLDLPPVFKADRPFICIIRDVRNGGILFMGRLADPR